MTLTPAVADTPSHARAIAELVNDVDGVVELQSGGVAAAASVFGSERINGIRLQPERIEVHVVVAWSKKVTEVAAAVRAAIGAIDARPVDVVIEDVKEDD